MPSRWLVVRSLIRHEREGHIVFTADAFDIRGATAIAHREMAARSTAVSSRNHRMRPVQ